MKILFVSAVFPYPLHSGGQVRIYNLLKRLSKSHEITLCAFIRDAEEQKHIAELSFCKKVIPILRGRAWQAKYVLRTIFSSYPFLYQTYNNAQMKEVIQKELNDNTYDLIHVEPGYVWLSLPKTTVPVVVSEHNVEHDVYGRYVQGFRLPFIAALLRKDVEKMKRWEAAIWKSVAAVTAASDDDAREIRTITRDADVSVVPNGVDTDMFVFRPKKTVSSSFTCLYVGAFRWVQNTDAVRYLLSSIWPAVVAAYPKATLEIVGAHPPASLVRQALPSVVFRHAVQDIAGAYKTADILLAPIRVGGGTRYKILESMASGLPVVTTKLGVQGIGARDGKEVWVADTTEQIVASIRDIIRGTARMRVLKQAHMLVEKEHSWHHIADQLETVWRHAYETTH
jgi:glycosyltransferase involved in cell wall biosynthesis